MNGDGLPNVLLSIEPEHAAAILDGEKWWEYWKVAPARDPPMRLVLYATAPVKAAVGVAWSKTVLHRPVAALLDATVASTPHDTDEVLAYFGDRETGYAIRLDVRHRFDEPIPLSEIRASGFDPTQNFRYLPDVDARSAETERVAV